MKRDEKTKKKRLIKIKGRRRFTVLYIIAAIILVITALIVWGLHTSKELIVRDYNIEYANIPAVFDGYKIVQLTDYHNGIYKNDNKVLIDKVLEIEPDVILLTGDMIDKNSEEVDGIVSLCKKLIDISPVIWVKGNNYYKADEKLVTKLDSALEELGIVSLSNDCYRVEKDGEHMSFCGLDDPEKIYSSEDLPKQYTKKATQKVIIRNLEEAKENSKDYSGFKILVSHRFTQYELFPQYNYSLAIAGHSHGGQLKLPGGIDIIGYDLSLFPKIKTGYNDIDGMPLIVSSGLGTSNLDLRLFNPPEIVSIQLQLKK